MQTYSVKIDAFEGPLDLLLHLIQQAEVDIYDIPVAQITEQYMAYIHSMQELALDYASEYLVMASTLLAMKSRMLLPIEEAEDMEADEMLEDEDDPRRELAEKLAAYKQYKEAAGTLETFESERMEKFSKAPSQVDDYIQHEDEQAVPDVGGITVYDMIQAYQNAKNRLKKANEPPAVVKPDTFTVEAQIEDVREKVKTSTGPVSFTNWLAARPPAELVASFLAVLELMKGGEILCRQDGNFSDIWMYRKEEGAS
ncbi:condensin subunit ScpA [Salsuginibacillus halophilus]|uniref:Segregation and condensation protein A n=1 Tax=Salsuginibacillus halophilus TaxID=517424 RepID=A0A2P8HW05_9BACI|nr:segregation/condensation protein A [Salsuginibacillus halophilus]PSL50400.1 condensin subunit ScpA [Salsuginibacillus halophilus]